MSPRSLIERILDIGSSKLTDLVEGDIIWARRYRTEKERLAIPEGHREGPYIILDFDGKTIKALMCTGVDKTEEYPKKYMALNPKHYSLKKDTYIRLESEKITSYQFIARLDSLSSHDLNQLYKKYKINHPGSKYEFHFDVGDIVRLDGELYYIFSHEYSYYNAFKIVESNKSKNVVVINGKRYDFNFEERFELPLDSNFELVDLIDEPHRVVRRYEQFIKEMKDKNEVRLGTIIKKKNDLYYIYGEYKEFYLTHRVVKSGKEISVGGEKYIIDLGEIQLPREISYEVVAQSSACEREEFKRMKTSNKKKQKAKHEKSKSTQNNNIFKDIQDGSILFDEVTFNKYFVYKRSGSLVELYNMNDISDNFTTDLVSNSFCFRYIGKLERIDFLSYTLQVKKYKEKKLVL